MTTTIPVAIVMTDATDTLTETQLARLLNRFLSDALLVDKYAPFIDSWRLPNHPQADGSDPDLPRLIWEAR